MKSEVVRTPEERFANLEGFPFGANFAEVPNPEDTTAPLRMHYVDEGPSDAEVILCLHGEPMWSYLYRKMIPVFVEAGYRVIAPDHIGFGRSDKLTQKTSYTFERHIEWIRGLVVGLDLQRITLFGQDWGGPIGLGVLAREEGRFIRAVAANTMLHTAEDGLAGRLVNDNHGVDGSNVQIAEELLAWILYSQRDPHFRASLSAVGATARDLPMETAAAYDAPFPDEGYKAGMRQFPALIPLTRGDVGSVLNRATWEALARFDKPFLTLFGDKDPGTGGWDAIFQERVPGAKGQPHETLENAGHFLQEDCGAEVAQKVVDWMVQTSA
ncbi:MAG: haloalkane dehalogenase [Myxococcota bacterium]|nr:haloalkane dehalogenase [Myxococcota bacterium]